MSDISPSNQTAMIVSVGCSLELWRRLTEEASGDFFTICNAISRDHRSEIEAALPRLESACAPCGPKAVVAELAPLVSLYGVPDKSEGEWKAFWGFYTDALSDLPLGALKAGVRAYTRRKDSEFFPKPGPLKALCDEAAAPARIALSRANRVCKPPAVSPEEMAYRLDHYRATREWRPQWGERPKDAA